MPPDAWPSSATFDLISEALSNEAERKDAIKKGGAIFAINLKNDKGEQKDWYIDLKDSGKVGKGAAPEGKKPTGAYIIRSSGPDDFEMGGLTGSSDTEYV